MYLTTIVILLATLASCYSLAISTRNENAPPCQCVPEEYCLDDNKNEGQGLMDIRSDSTCSNNMEICCKNPANLLEMFGPGKKLCGTSVAAPVDIRITGESLVAAFGEVPWTVAILYRDPSIPTLMYVCGGSLIQSQVVVTAAHCVFLDKNAEWVVRAGEWDTRTVEEPLPHQDRKVKKIIHHQHYDQGTLKNDIALLILDQPFEEADNIGTICLPPQNFHLQDVKCIASGWGKDTFKKGRHSSVLKLIKLPLVPRDVCQSALRDTRLGKFYHLHRSFVCAGGEANKDTCKGDGGSPLVCPVPGQPGRFFQMGIVSWGIGCGQNGTPAVYVNVPSFRNWIDKQLTALNIDIGSYNY